MSRIMWCCKIYAHQAIVHTRNLLKSTMLRPLKGEVGYKLAASKWSKTPAQGPLAFSCQIDLMFFLKFIVFCIPPWPTMLLHVDVHRSYTPIYRFHHLKPRPNAYNISYNIIQHHTTLMFYEMLHSFGHLVVSCCITLYLVV